MNLCPFCGAPLPGTGRFCPRCGAALAELTPPAAPEPPALGVRANGEPVPGVPIPVEPAPMAPVPEPLPPMDPNESASFKALRMHLHQESKAWRFFAIGVLVIMMSVAGLFVWLGGFTGLELGRDTAVGGAFMAGFFAVYGGFMTIMLLPVVIVGFVMGSKVLRYWEQSATDCTNALKHAGSAGIIVLAVFFSTPALIFIIINFVKTKRNRAELEAVLAWQKAKGPAAPHE